jgi:hypothetical protein
MTKMIKMSLVAALAVSGLSASIKDSSVSGKFMVEYNHATSKTGSTETTDNTWDYDVDVTVKTPIADSVTGILTVQGDGGDDADSGAKTTDAGVTVVKSYISAKVSSATVNVGKQSAATPFTGDERGNGVLALVPAGPVTLAAATFTNVNGNAAIQDHDVSVAAVIGGMKDVKYSLWYASISQTATAYTLNANAKVGPASIDFRHTDVDYSDHYKAAGLSTAKDKAASLTKISAEVAAGPATVSATYAMTGDNENRGVGVDISNDGDESATNVAGTFYQIGDKRDASAFILGASADVSGLTVGASYLAGSFKETATYERDFSELGATVAKSLNKSTSLTGAYTMGSIDNATKGGSDTDDTKLTVAMTYKF